MPAVHITSVFKAVNDRLEAQLIEYTAICLTRFMCQIDVCLLLFSNSSASIELASADCLSFVLQ